MIALRKDGVLNFILGDHLGSTSLTTDASGVVISELLYTAWGEVRHESGVTPTNHTYTGQYSNVNDFGLMYYRARWMDPQLGRFSQPDTIIPEQSQGVQAWDRFAYVNNNPVRYTDPSGHYCIQCLVLIGAIAVVTTTLYVYDPNFRSAMDTMAESVVSGLERQQQTEAKNREKLITAMEATFGQNGDKQNGPKFDCRESIGDAFACGAFITFVVVSGLILFDNGGCGEPETNCVKPKPASPTSVPTSTPANTPANTSTPAYTPTYTSTPTYTPTYTNTPTPVPTYTSTPTHLPTSVPLYPHTPSNMIPY
jgi:RHS repeat-associated protein